MIEILQSRLEILNNDEIMLQAIKEVFNERIEKEKPTIERTDSDKVLGEKFRAYEQAKRILSEALVDIGNYKNKKDNSKTFNKEK